MINLETVRGVLRSVAVAVGTVVLIYWLFAWLGADVGPLDRLLRSIFELLTKSAEKFRWWE